MNAPRVTGAWSLARSDPDVSSDLVAASRPRFKSITFRSLSARDELRHKRRDSCRHPRS
jgi:hypothetical protein